MVLKIADITPPPKTQSIPELGASCHSLELVSLSQKLKKNAEVQKDVEADVDLINTLFLTHTNSNPLTRFRDRMGPGGGRPRLKLPPPVMIELNTDVGDPLLRRVKFQVIEWDEDLDDYKKVGDEAQAWDIYDRWPHARATDRGFLGYDEVRDVMFIYDMDTPLVRIGKLNQGDDIGYGAASPGTVRVVAPGPTNLDFEVYGHNVLSTFKIPNGSDTYVTFYYDFNEEKHIAISTNKCLVGT
jgi:hypothetical protein